MEQFLSFNVGQIAQVVAILITIGVMFQQVKGDIKSQADRLLKIETRIEAFQHFLVNNARLEERLFAQGRRLDSLQNYVYGWTRQTQEETDLNINERT